MNTVLFHLVLPNLVEMVHVFLVKTTKCQAVQATQQKMSDGLIQIPCQEGMSTKI